MPGGRLTKQDRQQIASGLAQQLGYAEIARRLDRPTSTVSREVTRNGGPGRYQPDRAHLATERRARRRTPQPRSVKSSASPLEHGASTLGVATPAGARLNSMSRYLEYVGHDMIRSAEQGRKMLAAQRDT
ncbi:helix-turn-helix domain-containing protein [Nocardia sp. GCM10030253]|uniref:helix-turn-helix domain-containing protein n=1 Tax=Nocardia sp. GCM10030253 TaxID=3273404 RepID=UPI0036389795